MAALQNTDKISFVVDVLHVRAGKKLGTIRPDADGYYKMPLAVLGTQTDNRTYYDVEQFVSQLTSPTSYINKCITDGKLYGEYGHPPIQLMDENLIIPRLMMIDEKCVSHHIKKIETGEKLESGGKILYGWVKPSGPYAEFLQQNLDDSCMNTAFSLRSIAKSRQEAGITRRQIQHLITFDYVNAGGYTEASKRFAPGLESLVDIDLINNTLRITESAMECLSNTELNEIFGAKRIVIGNKTTTFVDKKEALMDDTGKFHSIFTSLIGKQ